MLIDLFFLPVHVPVGAPDVALQILAVCNVLVVELVLTKNSFGFLAHLQQRAFCWACPHKEQAQVTDQEHAWSNLYHIAHVCNLACCQSCTHKEQLLKQKINNSRITAP